MLAPPKRIAKRLADMWADPGDIRLRDALVVAEHFFGTPRRSGSHHVFRTPWPADPRVNLQEGGGGKAKAYQVRQLLAAVEKLELLSRGIVEDG
jgi:hypothetical protein